jgi:hypothetical protein
MQRTVATMLVAFIVVACLLPAVATSQSPPSKPACHDATYRQFDFWIGEWDVFLPDGSKAGENRIERIAAGCALQETWQGNKGFSGTSLNNFDSTDKKWHQLWVDSSGGRLDLAGGLEGSMMVLASTQPHPEKPTVKVTQKITWTPNADGTVRQHWQSSEDDGKTWTTVFDGKYVRKK